MKGGVFEKQKQQKARRKEAVVLRANTDQLRKAASPSPPRSLLVGEMVPFHSSALIPSCTRTRSILFGRHREAGLGSVRG